MQNTQQKGPKETQQEIYEGIIKTNRKKTGYIDFEDKPSVFFPEHSLGTAFHGDTVKFTISKETDRRSGLHLAFVREIISRERTHAVGILKFIDNQWHVIPDDSRLYQDIILPTNPDFKEGLKVYTSFTWEKGKTNPAGTLLKIIGKAGVHETEMQAIILEKGFESTFPIEVEREAEHIKKTDGVISAKEMETRKDMRGTLTMTIDPADAKDFDDALSLKDLGNGRFEIGVHIADVSHFVRPGTELDKEAQKREFSVYLVDRTIPMLPEILSNDLCSLNPHEDKRAFSAIFEMDMDGKVYSEWFGKSIINSDKRFAYEDAQASIENPNGEYHKELDILNKISYKLREEKVKNGAIDFETDEIKFILDENGKPIEVIRKVRKDAHKMIEDFMLLANKKVAEFISKKSKGKLSAFMYRTHDFPKADKIEDLSIFLKALGHELDSKDGHVTNKSIQRMISAIEGTPQETLIKTAILRSMSKAIYATKNIGHFGLGFDHYTHFTSPIRRYPDLLVHRILQKHLTHVPVTDKDLAFLNSIANNATQKEIAAAQAERDSVKYKQVEYMSEHVGETFAATISGVAEWGVFVSTDDTKAEGLIRMKDLGDDFFKLDEKTYSVVGDKTKKKFSLGDAIKVKLEKADRDNNTLDFVLAK